MLTIPLYIGWELTRTRNVSNVDNPLFRYKPEGAKNEEVYRLNIYQLRDNSYKFIPVQDGYVTYTDASGVAVKSSMSYEGFKRILVEYPYVVLLGKQQRSGKFTVFASTMFERVDDLRAVKIECLRYIKSVNVTGTANRVVKTDAQKTRMYLWEDYAFAHIPANALPTPEKQAFDRKNASYMLRDAPTGTKARYRALTTPPLLSREDSKLLIRTIAQAYHIDTANLQVRFVKRTSNKLGVAHGQFEDYYDQGGIRKLAITLMENAPHVIMHEMAHIISYSYYSRADGGSHGDKFAGVYAHVLDQFSPMVVPGRAAAFMQANGLKVALFNPTAPRVSDPAAAEKPVRWRSHRDFEQSHAIQVNPHQNRRLDRATGWF